VTEQPHSRLGAGLSLALLLLAATLLAAQAIVDLRRAQVIETDLAELHDVRYGLLNAEVWMEQLSA
jgi:hypothetical protein